MGNSYKDGYEKGKLWTKGWYPGGNYWWNDESKKRDEEWKKGFDAGLSDAKQPKKKNIIVK